MNARLSLSMLFVLLTTAACGGGGGGGGGAPAVVAPRDYVHTVTNANVQGASTMLENPLTFGRPDLVLLVTQNRSPEGLSAQANESYVGVLYAADAGDVAPRGRWYIVNMDLGAEGTMRPGMAFNVSIFEPGPNAFVHEVSRNGIAYTHLAVGGSPLHGDRDTRVFLTQRLSRADGTDGAVNRDSVLAYFTGANWAVKNQNGLGMPRGAAFNVVMAAPGPMTARFNTLSARSTLWHADPSLGPNAILHVSQGPVDSRGTNHTELALRYAGTRGEWGVANVDGTNVARYTIVQLLVRRP